MDRLGPTGKVSKKSIHFRAGHFSVGPNFVPRAFPFDTKKFSNSPAILAPYVFSAVYRGVKWSTWRVRTDCEQSLFSSKTVGKKQNKCGSVPVLPAARLHVTLTVTLARLLVLRSSRPRGFSRKERLLAVYLEGCVTSKRVWVLPVERGGNLTLVILTCSHGYLLLLFLLSTSPIMPLSISLSWSSHCLVSNREGLGTSL